PRTPPRHGAPHAREPGPVTAGRPGDGVRLGPPPAVVHRLRARGGLSCGLLDAAVLVRPRPHPGLRPQPGVVPDDGHGDPRTGSRVLVENGRRVPSPRPSGGDLATYYTAIYTRVIRTSLLGVL